MDQDDPADWSIDRVIEEICNTPSPTWANGTDLKPITNPNSIAQALRDNDIDGDNLLALEDKDIRSDLNITSFGQRRSLNNVICYLRSISTKYQARHPSVNVGALATPLWSRTPLLPHGPSPSLNGTGIYPSIENIRHDEHHAAYENSHSQSPRLFHPNAMHRKRLRDDSDTALPVLANSNVATNEPTSSHLSNLDTAIDQQLGVGGQDMQNNIGPVTADSNGAPVPGRAKIHKIPRRATLQPVSDSRVHGGDSVWSSEAIQIGTLNTLHHKSDKRDMVEPSSKRQKITGAGIAFEQLSEPHRTKKTVRSYRRYRPSDGISPQRGADPDESTAKNGIDDSREFSMCGESPVSGRLKRVVQRISSQLPQSHVVAQPKHLSAADSTTAEFLADLSDFEFNAKDLELLRRYPVEQEGPLLPIYGESDEEDRWTSASESPSPSMTTPIENVILSKGEIDTAIDQSFDQFKADWQSRHLSKTQAKAHKKWMIAAKNKFLHHGMLRECKLWRDKAGSRIHSLRDGIHMTQWQKAEDIKQQCLAIEASVHQLEEYSLYVDVLECDREPYLPPRTELNRPRPQLVHTVMENGDEDLDSDSMASFVAEDDEDNTAEHDAAALGVGYPTWDPKFAEAASTPNPNGKDRLLPEAHPPETKSDAVKKSADNRLFLPQERTNRTNQAEYAGKKVLVNISGKDTTPQSQKRSATVTKQAVTESAKRNPINMPYLTDSGDDDSDLDRSPRRPRTMYRKIGQSQDKAIDLTGSSPQRQPDSPVSVSSAGSVRTPKLPPLNSFSSNLISDRDPSGKGTSNHNLEKSSDRSRSLIFDVKRVSNMNWDEIEPFEETDAIDHRLALAKAVYELSTLYARNVLDYLTSIRDDDDLKEILTNGLEAEKDAEEEIEDVERKNQENAQRLTHLLISYSTGYNVNVTFELSDRQADDAFEILSTSLREFRQLVQELLRGYICRTELRSGTNNIPKHELSEDPDTTSSEQLIQQKNASPFKARKRKVVQSKYVLDQQRQDQHRVAQQEKKRALLLQQQSNLGIESSQLAVSINVDEPIVYLDPHIAAHVKPHQVEGIRFMWRELIENDRQEGCLLAHTMGLGKTMQVIALLASIAQCNASDDPAIRGHIPPHLQRLRILVLCPFALIENWYEEFLKWLPDPYMLGLLIRLESKTQRTEADIQQWAEDGGVLIMNYEKFRNFVLTSDNEASNVENQNHQLQSRDLIEGADIVIADEAHRLKNSKSRANKAASLINTKSRIALTGSPLNNHLEEYHTMIDWISPGYLGNIVQFRARYAEPINQGLYSESTSWERKESMKRLHMLKKTIAPKTNRADITALSKDLPTKTEFFLTITMTKEQVQAYQAYVECLRNLAVGGSDKHSMSHVWSWLNVLSLLLNHPSCFITKLRECEAKATSTAQTRRNESDDEIGENTALGMSTDDVVVAQQPELATAMQKVLDIFEEARVILRMDDPSLSTKSLLIQKILEEAVRLGEKTLIFSKSIPSLDYYEKMLKGMKLAYKRIDGQARSAATNRQQEVAQFNESEEFKVFLISTRAGGLGLNIQSASRVIINDFDFNPTWEEQAVGRAYRIGQTKPVFVYRFLMGGTFEELVHNKAVFKTQLFCRVVDEKNIMSHAAKKPNEYLFDPKDVPQKDFSECLGKDSEVLDRVLQKVDCVRDIFLTETFFQDTDEKLNEQELKEANDLLEMERLERDNPEEYARRVQEKHRLQAQVAQQGMQSQASKTPPNTLGNQQLNHYLNLNIPSLPNAQFKVTSGTTTAPVFGSLPHTPRPGSGYGDEFAMSVQQTRPDNGALFRSMDDQAALMRQLRAEAMLQQSPNVTSSSQALRTRSPYFRLNDGSTAVMHSMNGTLGQQTPGKEILITDKRGYDGPSVSDNNGEHSGGNDVVEGDTGNKAAESAQGCRPQ